MLNVNAVQEDLISRANEESSRHSLRRDVGHGENSNIGNEANSSTTGEGEQVPRLATHPRKHGVSWLSAEKINGVIDPKQHVDWVMTSQFGISLEYLINFVHNLCDEGYCRYEAYERVMAQFYIDRMHADVVSRNLFDEPFNSLIADIHDWISGYEPDEHDEHDDWSRSKRGIHDYVVWAVMEELAFVKMDEVNPNP